MPLIKIIAVDVKNDSIYLKGNISNLTNHLIDSIGFILSPNKKPNPNDQTVFSHKYDENGNYANTIVDKLHKDSVYYARAIYQYKGEIYYGNELSFISKNLNLPQIYDFSPKEGNDKEFIKIYGCNFSDKINDITVYFGSKLSEIVSCSFDRIVVKVPPYSQTDSCHITVKIKTNQVISSKAFFLAGPIIDTFTPTEGKGQITITINGDHFSGISWRNTVYLGSTKLEIIQATEKQLVVKTDLNGIIPGLYPVSIITNSKAAFSKYDLRVLSAWKQLASLPIDGLAQAVIFKINNKIFLCTGTTDTNNIGAYTNLFMEYDLTSNQWTRKADFPGPRRSGAIGFSIGDKGYIGLGRGLSDFWEYNSSTDAWTQKADFPAGARENSGAFSYNNKGYVLMGNEAYNHFIDFWSYDPETEQWQKLPDFISKGLNKIQLAVINDKLYILGGIATNYDMKTDKWQFDFITNTWKFFGINSVLPRCTFYDNNKCYIMYTKIDKTAPNFLYEFLPETNSLILQPVFPGLQRSEGAGILINGKVYYGTGASFAGYDGCLNDFWLYDPK